MCDMSERSYEFTLHGNRMVAQTVNDTSFPDMDAAMIFSTLRDSLFPVPFCEYLKRYIFLKAGMHGSYRKIPFESYYETLVDAFHDTGTPASLNRGNTRLSLRAREWLQQRTVRRHVVLLLGFGLSMSPEDVNLFLTCGIHDHHLDDQNPLERICSYCYENRYGYSKMEQLWRIYQSDEAMDLKLARIAENQPRGREASQRVIEQDTALLRDLFLHKSDSGATFMILETRRRFQLLYDQVCKKIQSMRQSEKPVQPHDVEDVICSSIPKNQHGNLVSEMNSSLKAELAGKRMSRQRIHELLHRISEPNRYDLITLRFFLCAEPVARDSDPMILYKRFLRETNEDLEACGYSDLYTASPYECFILMCILSIDPLATYTDVLEMAYNN